MNEYNMALYFPKAGNLNSSNAGMCSDVSGLLRSGSGNLFELSDSSRSRTFTISPTTSAIGCHLVFEHDYNYHTAFQGLFLCIMYKSVIILLGLSPSKPILILLSLLFNLWWFLVNYYFKDLFVMKTILFITQDDYLRGD